ncbi:MAG: A24 family peptidase [Candidatus Odinarchaeia archaeon]
MEVKIIFFYIGITIAILFLIYASISDIKQREVKDYIWISFSLSGLTLSVIRIIIEQFHLTNFIFSTCLGFILAALSFYLGFTGGADAKALISISIINPDFYYFLFFINLWTPLILNIYMIMLIGVLLLVICIFAYNLITKSYKELEKLNLTEKIKILTLCFKKDVDNLNLRNYTIVERINKVNKNIEFIFHTHKIKEDNEILKELIEFKTNTHKKVKVWVYPNWPLIPLILVSYLVTILIYSL